jgi:uncharacterized repeat protein (TIGR03803 family)
VTLKRSLLAAAIAAAPATSLIAGTPVQGVYWSFSGGADGSQPRGDLLLSASGVLLYGTASSGGINQSGTVFAINPKSKTAPEQTLYQFTGGADGSLPSAGLIADTSGALYGTAARDGGSNAGTVFKISPPAAGQTAWTETTLWSFTGGVDGAQPVGSLIADISGSGVLYGTTSFGGAHGFGTVFSLTPPAAGQTAWTEHTLWSFTGGADGARPVAALLQTSAGALFGTAEAGGSDGAGTVFELTQASASQPWAFNTIWTFTGGADGASPTSTLTAFNNQIYGTTEFGGSGDCGQARFPYYGEPDSVTAPALNAAYVPPGGNSCGVVFALTPPATAGQSWTQSIVWSFTSLGDGGNPVSRVLIDSTGTLHGLTPEYGVATADSLGQYGDKGNAYLLSPPTSSGAPFTETTTLVFRSETRGDYARAGVIAGPGGKHYATQTFGGKYWVHTKVYGYGTVISVP